MSLLVSVGVGVALTIVAVAAMIKIDARDRKGEDDRVCTCGEHTV